MEIIIHKESDKYPGFYIVKNNAYIVISPDGKVLNTHTGNIMKVSKDAQGYAKVFVRDSENRIHGYLLHRLLALTFIGRPDRHLDKDFSLLEVNHKDGDKFNFILNNLEWVTPKENMQHAINNGLAQGKQVLARHILSGDILHFNNIVECSKLFNLNIMRISRHLRSVKSGTLTKNWYVFKYDDGNLWPELSGTKLQPNSWDSVYGMWYAKNINDGMILYNDILSNLCGFINLKFNYVNNKVSTNGVEVVFKDWIVWYDDTPLVSAVRTLASRKLPEGIRTSIKIKCTNIKSNEIIIFDSINKTATYLNIASVTLTRIMNSKDGIYKQFKLERTND